MAGVSIDGLELYGAQSSTAAVEASVDVTSAPGEDASETILTGLEALGSMSLSGRATGLRLTSKAGYSSDPQTALGEWLQQFEALVAPEQGDPGTDGWSITDDERDRTITVTATDASWTFAFGSTLEARWDLSVTRGEFVGQQAARSPGSASDASASPSNTVTLDGNDLGTLTEKRTEKRIQVSETPIALSGTSETVIVPESGVTRSWTFTGRRHDTTANLRTFDDNLRALNGGNQTVTYQTGFPGDAYTVMVNNYDSTYNAGSPDVLDYAISLTEGLAL